MSKSSALVKSAKDSLPPAIASVIIPMITASPILAAPLLCVVGLYGWSVVYRQERFNEFIQDIIDNPSIFSEHFLSTVEFRDALIVFLDDYFKIRDEQKLKQAHNIFRNFASDNNKPLYPLERYSDTLLKISDAGIRYLGFINDEIPKIKEAYLDQKMHENNNPRDEESRAEFRKIYIENEPLSTFVDQSIEDRVKKEALRSPKHRTTPLEVESSIRESLKNDLNLVISELEQLGILKQFSYQTQGWTSVSVSGYNLTHYGQMFISVIKPDLGGVVI
jgi:hypothetical protein